MVLGVPFLVLLVVHQSYFHQPWRLERCNPSIHPPVNLLTAGLSHLPNAHMQAVANVRQGHNNKRKLGTTAHNGLLVHAPGSRARPARR